MVCGRHGCGRDGHCLRQSWFVAVMAVAAMVIVCGSHGLWPSLSNSDFNIPWNNKYNMKLTEQESANEVLPLGVQ